MDYFKEMLKQNRERLEQLKRYADRNERIRGAMDELSYQIELLEYSMSKQEQTEKFDEIFSGKIKSSKDSFHDVLEEAIRV